MPTFRLFLASIFVFCFSVIPALASDCTAPVQLYRISSSTPGFALGFSVAAIGDINGDTKTDFIVGDPAASPNGTYFAGAAYVYSGADGNLIYQLNSTVRGESFGQAVVGLGDINNDGKPDFIVRAATSVHVYSAPDSLLLYQINIPPDAYHTLYGAPFAAAADVNGDGTAELIISITSLASVFVYSGTGDSLLYQINGSTDDQFGFSVSAIGDINDDGNADFVVGAPYADSFPGAGPAYYGSVYLYSGIDGTPIRQENGVKLHDFLGWAVAPVGDLDGDGKTDFAATAAYDRIYITDQLSAYAYIISGHTDTILYQIKGKDLDNFGWSTSGVDDIDGDGIPDFVVGAIGDCDALEPGGSTIGTTFVYSGIDGHLIYQVKSYVPCDLFGNTIAGLGDLDGNGKADILIGAPTDLPEGRTTTHGSAYVFVSKTVPKGDLNFDSTLTIADVTNLLNVVFIDNSSAISPCTADLNCDGKSSPADLVLLLNRVFLQTALPCS